MTILLAAALAAVQPQPIAPPAPPSRPPMITMTAPPAPPSPAEYQRAMARLTQPPAILDIRVTGEGGLLWQRSVRVGLTGANIHQDRTEAEPGELCACDACIRSFGPDIVHARPELRSLWRAGRPVRVNVAWTRLPREDACAVDGSRTVQLQTTAQIPPRGSATLHGDGGLTVEIRRH